MSRQLYQEALADAKQIRQLAEDNAKRAVLDEVTPRIKELIERQLFEQENQEATDEDDAGIDRQGAEDPADHEVLTDGDEYAMHDASLDQSDQSGVLTINLGDLDNSVSAGGLAVATGPIGIDQNAVPAVPQPPAPTMPPPVIGNGPGIVGQDSAVPPINGMVLPEDQPIELSIGALSGMEPLIGEEITNEQVCLAVENISQRVRRFKLLSPRVSKTTGFREQITETIDRVEDMYDYLQESTMTDADKKKLETKLESCYLVLNKLMEQKMAKNRIHENDVTLKLTGLPDDVDLDQVGVDLIQDEDADASDEGDTGDEGGGDELDFGADDSDGGDDASGGDDDLDVAKEGAEMTDETVVEIDEGMLRREIARMKRLNEFKVPATSGGVDKSVLDDFGDGSDDGDAWTDHDVTTADDLKESDVDDMGEGTGLDEVDFAEGDELEELEDRRYGDESGAGSQHHQSDAGKNQFESATRRCAFERRLQERLARRMLRLKREHRNAKRLRSARKLSEVKQSWVRTSRRMNESKARMQKFRKIVVESRRSGVALRQNGATPSVSPRRSTELKAAAALRRELAETNLFNTKLLHANKLLQNESLSSKQKAQVIERLDEARTSREVKLVYDSLTKTMAPARPMTENVDRKTGSSSRVTRSGTTVLNESNEAARWAKLAGLQK